VGEKKAKDIIRHAVFVLSMGTNDFLQNYFLQSMRTDQFTLQEYQNFLVSCMSHDIEVLSLSLSLKRLIGLLLVLNKLLIGLYYSAKQFLDKLARVKKN
jgi:hypothetical protein